MRTVICFTRGRSFYQIARIGDGYVGFRDGRVIATGPRRDDVARTLISGALEGGTAPVA